jgi:DNA-binding NarL/FixJ family response regulator
MQVASQRVVELEHVTTSTSFVHIVTIFPTPFLSQMLMHFFADSPRLRIGPNYMSSDALSMWCALQQPLLALFHPSMLQTVVDSRTSLREGRLPEPTWVLVATHTDSAMLMRLAATGIDHMCTAEQIQDIDGFADLLLQYVDVAMPTDPRIARARRKLSIARDEHDSKILTMLVTGRKNSEIAATVYLSEQTVKNRLSQMMRAANVSNRTELALLFCA